VRHGKGAVSSGLDEKIQQRCVVAAMLAGTAEQGSQILQRLREGEEANDARHQESMAGHSSTLEAIKSLNENTQSNEAMKEMYEAKLRTHEKTIENQSATILALSEKKPRRPVNIISTAEDSDLSTIASSVATSKKKLFTDGSGPKEEIENLKKENHANYLKVASYEAELRSFQMPDLMDLEPQPIKQSETEQRAEMIHYKKLASARRDKSRLQTPIRTTRRETRSTSNRSMKQDVSL